MHKIGDGKEADIYLDETVFKLFKNQSTGRNRAEVEQTVLDFLLKQSFPVPTPKGIFEEGKRVGLKMSFIPGSTLEGDYYIAGHGRRVGEILGNLHYQLHNIPIETIPHNLPRAENLFTDLAREHNLYETLCLSNSKNLVLAHGDFHPANIIDSADRRVVIDWSRAYIGTAESDIATTLTILLLFPPPTDATPQERTILQKNLYETKRVYISTYNELRQLDRLLIMQWIRLIAARFSKNDEKVMKLINGDIDLPWP